MGVVRPSHGDIIEVRIECRNATCFGLVRSLASVQVHGIQEPIAGVGVHRETRVFSIGGQVVATVLLVGSTVAGPVKALHELV